MPLTKELLKQLREMEGKATPGKWTGIAIEYVRSDAKPGMLLGYNDSYLILLLRNNIIPLLDEIERLQGEAESNKRMLDMLKTGLQEGMTNDPKEWWEDMIANWPNKPATSNEIRDIINCTRSRFKEEVIKALEGMKHKGPGGHGECCVCQTCKFPYDECMCTYNQALQEAIEIIKKL